MTVTVYRYDDASAPVMSYDLGSVINVLDACLVNGYGSKPAAGWTKAFSGTGKGVYQQGAGSTGMFLRVDQIVARQMAYMRGFESMSDIDTGTNPFPTVAMMTNGVYNFLSTNTIAGQAKAWVLIADSKRFYLWTGGNIISPALLSTSATYQNLFFFGDLTSYRPGDVYHCTIFGGPTSSWAADQSGAAVLSYSSYTPGHYTARSADQISLSTAIGKVSMNTTFNQSINIGASSYCPVYPDPVTGGLQLVRIYATNGATVKSLRGHFPGLWAPMNALPGNNGDTVSGAGELAGRTFILLDSNSSSVRGRLAIEISDTWD